MADEPQYQTTEKDGQLKVGVFDDLEPLGIERHAEALLTAIASTEVRLSPKKFPASRS
jgi:hypothetical protein